MSTDRLKPSLRAAIVAATLAASAGLAGGQAPGARFEIRPFVGAFIPTGNQRDVLEDAVLTGAGLSWRVIPAFGRTDTKVRWATALCARNLQCVGEIVGELVQAIKPGTLR